MSKILDRLKLWWSHKGEISNPTRIYLCGDNTGAGCMTCIEQQYHHHFPPNIHGPSFAINLKSELNKVYGLKYSYKKNAASHGVEWIVVDKYIEDLIIMYFKSSYKGCLSLHEFLGKSLSDG